MNKEQIIQMASQAGINVSQGHLLRFAGVEDDLERFAASIRAAVKEEDAKICEELAMKLTLSGGLTKFDPADCAHAIRASK